MTSRKRSAKEKGPSRKGAKRRPSKRCEEVRAWLEKYGSAGEFSGEAKAELLQMDKPGALMECLEQMFREGSMTDRMRILRGVAPVLGSRFQPFLRRVVSETESRLAEKEIALERLRELGEVEEEDSLRALREAREFVESLFPAAELRAGVLRGSSGELSELFVRLAGPFQIAAARQILDADPKKAVVLLENALDRTGTLPEGILPLLSHSPEEETAGLLLEWYGRSESKPFRKEIRRILHKRRGRGWSVPEPVESEPGEPVWKPPVPSEPVGLLAMPDATGSRMVWVMRHQLPRGILLFGGWVHDVEGLKEVVVQELSRKESEAYKRSLLEDEKLSAVDADPAYCAYLIEEAYQKGGPASSEQGEAYKRSRSLLRELLPRDAPFAPIYRVWKEDGGQEEIALEDPLGAGADLLKKGALENWFLETDRLWPFLEMLQEIRESRIIVHPLQKQERIASFYRETTRELFSDGPYRTLWKRRVEDAAWVLYKRGLQEDARRLCRIGRHLGNMEGDASREPFFVQLVQKTLEMLLENRKTEEAAKPSWIVKPGSPLQKG